VDIGEILALMKLTWRKHKPQSRASRRNRNRPHEQKLADASTPSKEPLLRNSHNPQRIIDDLRPLGENICGSCGWVFAYDR